MLVALGVDGDACQVRVTMCYLDSSRKPANHAIDRTNMTGRILREFAVRRVCTRKSCRLELILTRFFESTDNSMSILQALSRRPRPGVKLNLPTVSLSGFESNDDSIGLSVSAKVRTLGSSHMV